MLDSLAPYGQTIAFVAAILVAFGVFLSGRDSDKTLEERDAALRASNAQLLKRADENAHLQEELKTQAQETVRQVTGGNAYVRLILAPGGRPNEFMPIVSQGGERSIPAFDVNIAIDETGKCDALQTWTMRDVMATGINSVRRIYFPSVAPAMALPLGVLFKPSCDDAYYLVMVYTRNRVTLQQIVLRKSKGTWAQALRVIDPRTNVELWQHVDGGMQEPTWPDISEVTGMLRDLPGALEKKP